MKVSIIGNGNIAGTLAEAITKSGHDIVARNRVRDKIIAIACDCGYASIEDVYEPSGIFIVSVSDNSAGDVITKGCHTEMLKKNKPIFNNIQTYAYSP